MCDASNRLSQLTGKKIKKDFSCSNLEQYLTHLFDLAVVKHKKIYGSTRNCRNCRKRSDKVDGLLPEILLGQAMLKNCYVSIFWSCSLPLRNVVYGEKSNNMKVSQGNH